MGTYAIGDIQGCAAQLMQLLDLIQFNEHHDRLWFTGDLVNRGPDSLSVLRTIKNLNSATVVLGNHDLHLLAAYYHRDYVQPYDTFMDVFNAPDADELCAWLRFRPLLHYDESLNFMLVHAGVAPHWTLIDAQALSQEVATVLQSDQASDFLLHLYGKEPALWDDNLCGYDRIRCIINYFTRVRLCDAKGRLNLSHKGSLSPATEMDMDMPWFQIPWRKTQAQRIIFGHWAALQGKIDATNVFGLDTGCVWGNKLTALRLEDLEYFQVDCTSVIP